MRILMITLPQVWAASFLISQPKKKPLLMGSSFGGRFPILFLIIATLLWTQTHLWLTVTFLVIFGILVMSRVISGTGLDRFAERFPERYFDVGVGLGLWR